MNVHPYYKVLRQAIILLVHHASTLMSLVLNLNLFYSLIQVLRVHLSSKWCEHENSNAPLVHLL